jgi:hypothetical protein
VVPPHLVAIRSPPSLARVDGLIPSLVALLGLRSITNNRRMAGVTADLTGEIEGLIFVVVALGSMRLGLTLLQYW